MNTPDKSRERLSEDQRIEKILEQIKIKAGSRNMPIGGKRHVLYSDGYTIIADETRFNHSINSLINHGTKETIDILLNGEPIGTICFENFVLYLEEIIGPDGEDMGTEDKNYKTCEITPASGKSNEEILDLLEVIVKNAQHTNTAKDLAENLAGGKNAGNKE